MNKKRLTIALLVGNISDDFSGSVTKGAIEAAEKLDANLIVIPGRYIEIDYETLYKSRFEYQFNSLFSCITSKNVDAVVVAIGSIAYASETELKLKFLESYTGVPIITVAEKIGNMPCVKFNNATGVTEALEHLISVQGRRRIGMLSGFTANKDALERLEAYKSVLATHELPFEERMVSYGQLSPICTDAAKKLLDDNPELDAIICSNDAMATALYPIMRERGIVIGDMIAVVGFDDLPYAIELNPPLASIRANAEQLGYNAIELCVSVKLGCGDIKDVLVDTRFIPRQSCGSMDYEISRINSIFASCSLGKHIELTDEIVSVLISSGCDGDPNFEMYKKYIDKIIEALYAKFIQGEASIQDVADILGYIEKALEYSPHGIINKEMIKTVVEMLYSFVVENINDLRENRELFNKLYAFVYKDLFNCYADRLSARADEKEELFKKLSLFMRDMLMFSNNPETSYAIVLKQLYRLNVRFSMLYTYDKVYVNELPEKWVCPEQLRLMAIQDNRDIISIPAANRAVERDNIFGNMFFPSDRRITLIGSPLFSNELQFGLFFCEMNHRDMPYLELVTYQLSAAVKIISLLKKQSESLTQLYDDNAELDAISKRDELTGLLNRRGFYKNARESFADAKTHGKTGVIAYVDTDYLKIINDRFGHNEGDSALKATASLLERTFRQSDIIGRVGGDEFIAFAVTDRMGFGDIVRSRMQTSIDEYNTVSEKPYNLSVSMGIYEFGCTRTSGLEHAVEMADDFLYKSKKSRPEDFSIIKK